MSEEFDLRDAPLNVPQNVKGTSVMLNGKPQPPPKHRLSMQANIYHQQNGGDAVHVDCSTWRKLESDEQPFQRVMKIGPEAIQFPLGWVGEENLSVGLLVVENLEPPNHLSMSEDRPVYVSFKGSRCELLVRNGGFQQIEATQVDQFCLRAAYSQTRVRITAIPG